ncbi:MAG TPA: L,D-transpeptidase family protein [Pseudomonadales bacterium]|nr:L,D-transpeptidase family protein [Pseudomonadales bacterium]
MSRCLLSLSLLFFSLVGFSVAQADPLFTAERASKAITLLQDADSDGLVPADYNTVSLVNLRDTLAADPANPDKQKALDTALVAALSLYVHDMWLGRVDPEELDYGYNMTTKHAALNTRVNDMLIAEDPATIAAALRPALPLYTALRTELARYRQLAAAHPDSPALPPLPGKKLEAGSPWTGTAALAQWLVVLGDADAVAAVDEAGTYSGAVVDAVKHFQARHGLDVDGVIGAQTLVALNTPLPQRVRQIELAMERLRWLDATLPGKKFVMVNIPQFTLWAYAPVDGVATPRLTMHTVVGQAGKTETPIFARTMSEVTFNPYWDVPGSIMVKEMLPKLQHDPDYLDKEEMERIDHNGTVYTGRFDQDARKAILSGAQRIRQRPGAKNALGKLELTFPNEHDIYMHDTPAKAFFTRSRRDFSHGCIRVANPVGLALFALEANGGWDEAKIAEQGTAGVEKHVPLKERFPVVLAYLTANVDESGHAVFVQDIYNRDMKLAAALGRRH